MSSLTLALIMIAGLLLAFALLHSVLLRVPYEQMAPRERFRWPVWRWFPLVVITGLVATLVASTFISRRATNRSSGSPGEIARAMEPQDPIDVTDRQMVAGKEGPKMVVNTGGKAATTGTSGKMTKPKK